MKRFISVLLIVVMSFSLSISSLGASFASSSDADKNLASSSNAIHFQDSLFPFQVNDNVMLMSSDDLEYGTDYRYLGIYQRSDGTGPNTIVVLNQNSDGSFSYTAPSGYVFRSFRLSILRPALPSSGTYGFSADISQGHIDYDISSCEYFYNLVQSNVETYYPNGSISSWSNTGQSYTVSANVEITSRVAIFEIAFNMAVPESVLSFGDASFSFTLYQGSGSSVSPGIDDNVQQDISNSVDDISSGINNLNSGISDVNDSLREIVQTISLQLEALWNQLYNYMHVPQLANDDKNTGLITDSIDTMGSDVVDSVDSAASDITSNADSNAQAIQDNADKNTDTITNGYDNSQMDSDAERLNDTFTEYENVESAITDEVTSYIDDYTIPDWTDFLNAPGIVSAITFFGGYMQQIYNSMGSFSVQITVSLTLIFVLMLVGYHRFKI